MAGATSGRAGLFTIKETFNPNLYDQVEATTRGQKSGALRLEFGKFNVPDAATTAASVRCTVNTGIVAVVTPTKVGTPTGLATSSVISGPVSGVTGLIAISGVFGVAASGSFQSGFLHIDVVATGSFSGQASGMDINYMVVGY